jgi:hypothetical protein
MIQIQVNSDSSLAVDAAFSAFIDSTVATSLSRFEGDVSRVEVHLSDVNSEKFGTHDKRCLMEARPTGQDPVVVTDEAATIEAAVRGATQKMVRLLTSRFGKRDARR